MADSFLRDLEELSDVEETSDSPQIEEEDDADDLDNMFKLHNSRRFNETMQKINEDDAVSKGDEGEEAEHQLILECNSLLLNIDSEIHALHNFIRDRYRSRFPELESLVHQPVEYARVVDLIGNEMDLSVVDLQGLLPPAVVISVSVMASSTRGKSIPEQALQKIRDACGRSIALDAAREKVLEFIETRMQRVAPNLSAVVGSGVAARLAGAAGGLSALASMPACNVQLLGAKGKAFDASAVGFAAPEYRIGYIEDAEIFRLAPPSLRKRACRLVAAKSALAARVDSMKADPIGKFGAYLRDEILKGIERWQKPNPARIPKPLPVPDSVPRKRRGGRRLRKMKERYGMTEARLMRNRMAFGVAEESSLGDGFGEGFGMRIGKFRLGAGPTKRLGVKKYENKSRGYEGSASSLGFSSVQGLELVNPKRLDVNNISSSKYFY